MSVSRTSPGKSPDQLRRERAQVEYHACRFHLMTVKTSQGDRGLVYVHSSSGAVYAVTDTGRCSCPDFQRRCRDFPGAQCKHQLMTEMFLNGEPPALPGEGN
jgi:predicted nucleic acid-binding Zn finger protein